MANIKEPLTLVIAVAAFVAGAFAGINAAVVVVAAGVIGIPLFSAPSVREAQQKGGR